MVIVTAMPSDLIADAFERYKVPGAKLPFRFVPSWTNSDKKREKKDVKIRISSTIEKQFPSFHLGNTEEAIDLIRVHKSIVADMKLEQQVKDARAQKKANKTQLTELTGDDADENATEISDLEEANRELRTTIATLQSDAFDLFEKLLGPDLACKWQEIVKLECESADYVSLLGEKPGVIRGRVFGAMGPCYFAFVRLFCNQDSAEQMRHYIVTNMFLNLDRGITIEQGVTRFWDMNQKLAFLPCLRHKEGAPSAWPALNTPFSELESCGIVLYSTPLRIVTAWYASGHNEFPTDLKALMYQLSRIVDDTAEQYKLLTTINSKIIKGLGNGGGPGNQAQKRLMASESDPIPRKRGKPQRGGGNQAGANGNSGKNGCDLCKKFNTKSPNAWKSHNTEDCNKYNSNGTLKGASNQNHASRKRVNFANVSVKKAVKQAKKEARKKYHRKLKKHKKRGKKGRYYDSSSSDSSSSDSDSE